jgi:Flp pilus assembly protein TadG
MATLRSRLARWRSETGAEFVEFGLALPLLLLVVLGIMDFGMMFQQYEVITNAAREGARVGVLPGYTLTDAQSRAASYASQVTGPGVATVPMPTTTQTPIGANCMTTITVVVTYPHQYMFVGQLMSMFGGSLGTKTITGTATMRSEVASGPCP